MQEKGTIKNMSYSLCSVVFLLALGCSIQPAKQQPHVKTEHSQILEAQESYSDTPELRNVFLEGYRSGVSFAVSESLRGGGWSDISFDRTTEISRARAEGFEAGRLEVNKIKMHYIEQNNRQYEALLDLHRHRSEINHTEKY